MNALYFPFHLCHDRTLEQVLNEYQTVHFRDFMALQLTSMMGTTAFPDRMGNFHPKWVEAGRIVQGYDLSGAMSPKTQSAVDQDLADSQWRGLFQESLLNNPRFQRGLFGSHHSSPDDSVHSAHLPDWLQFQGETLEDVSFDVERVRNLSRQRLPGPEYLLFEYGWAMIKTSVSLIYTIELCERLNLIAVTDSPSHYQLLLRTCEREHISLQHSLIKREHY